MRKRDWSPRSTTPTIAVLTGGLACVIGVGVLALAVPEFVRYQPDLRDTTPG